MAATRLRLGKTAREMLARAVASNERFVTVYYSARHGRRDLSAAVSLVKAGLAERTGERGYVNPGHSTERYVIFRLKGNR